MSVNMYCVCVRCILYVSFSSTCVCVFHARSNAPAYLCVQFSINDVCVCFFFVPCINIIWCICLLSVFAHLHLFVLSVFVHVYVCRLNLCVCVYHFIVCVVIVLIVCILYMCVYITCMAVHLCLSECKCVSVCPCAIFMMTSSSFQHFSGFRVRVTIRFRSRQWYKV